METLGEFEYIRDYAQKYGTMYLRADFEAFVDSLSETTLSELRAAHDLIDSRGDAYRISRWLDLSFLQPSPLSAEQETFAQKLGQLLVLFGHLAENGIPPFSSEKVCYIDEPTKPNWQELPEELRYLIEPAETYGKYTSESEILMFLENPDPEDVEALVRIAERIRINSHLETIYKWIGQRSLVAHFEARLLYWFLGMLDHADVL